MATQVQASHLKEQLAFADDLAFDIERTKQAICDELDYNADDFDVILTVEYRK